MNDHLETIANRKQKVGRVVSDKMEKTVVVAVDYLRPHPLYRKTVRKTHKFYAHDEQNDCYMGDLVRIEETRPLSRLKRWRVVEVIESKRRETLDVLRADVTEAAPQAAAPEEAAS